VAPELYHIGCGAVRLPGADNWERLDAAEGRVRLDAVTLRAPNSAVTVHEAEEATLLGTVAVVEDGWASGGKTVSDVDVALGNGVELTIDAAVAGDHDCFVRYASVGGGVLRVQLDDEKPSRLELADTGEWQHYGDHLVTVNLSAGKHTLRLQRDRIYAEWSDGAKAEWTMDKGFSAEHAEVTLGVGGDRLCPDTWSGEKRIMIHSTAGSERTWSLPESWADVTEAQLIPLTDGGRDMAGAETVPVDGRICRLALEAGVSYVLISA